MYTRKIRAGFWFTHKGIFLRRCFTRDCFSTSSSFCFVFSLQYLLVRHPLLSILFLTVVFFGVAMCGFSLFHLYLVLTNQTTNEFNKRWFGKTQNKISRQVRTSLPKTETTRSGTSKRRTTDNKNTSVTTQTRDTGEKLQSSRTSTPYNRGIWRNVAEVLRGWETLVEKDGLTYITDRRSCWSNVRIYLAGK